MGPRQKKPAGSTSKRGRGRPKKIPEVSPASSLPPPADDKTSGHSPPSSVPAPSSLPDDGGGTGKTSPKTSTSSTGIQKISGELHFQSYL